MSNKIWYCPICGMNKQLYSNTVCDWCGNQIQMVESIHPYTYYLEKAQEIYSKEFSFNVTEEEEHNILIEEVKNNPLFDEIISKQAFQKWQQQSNQANASYFQQLNKNIQEVNKPKCPTCGSTNISKISAISKVAGAATFGLFSKTAKSQFKCNNCGYKW